MRQNIALFSLTFLAILAITAITQPMLPDIHSMMNSSHAGSPHPYDVRIWSIGIVQDLLLSLAAVPSMVAVHRFVLMNETGTALNNGRRLLYFAAWLTAYRILPALAKPIASAGHSPLIFVHVLLNFIWTTACIYLSVRFALSFPAIALDANYPLSDSWSRTRGRWWKVATVMVFGFLPLAALGLSLVFSASEWIVILTGSVLSFVWPAVGAALASELYRNLDGRLQHEPQLTNFG